MKKPGLYALVTLVVALTLMGSSLAAGQRPHLGLDLQGGVAIVLAPATEVDDGALDQTIEILRSRVDALGVAEPEITRQGDTIVVQLPGVTDRARAREVIGQTAELRFRPVIEAVPASLLELDPSELTTTTTTTESGDDTTTTTTTDSEATTTTGGADEQSLGRLQLIAQTDEDDGTSTTTDTSEAAPEDPTVVDDGEEPSIEELLGALEITDRDDDTAEVPVVLPDREGDLIYRLEPAPITGEIVSTAAARFGITNDGGWGVLVEFTGEGGRAWNDLAASIVGRQLAIVLDGVVVSAPTIQTAQFDGEAVISGNFSEGEAKDLALVLRFGALPVELEEQTVQEVSATLGKDALDAGLVAGGVGVGLVALYLISYYRLLGVTAVLSLAISATLLWTIVSFLSETQGLALTLAGITGIIVSIGVAVDSNIVYYERIRDEVRDGRATRSAVEHSFARSFSTILKADAASLIGAGFLYWLTVGPVRGFAFFMGLATLLDVVVSYFFMRPAAIWLGRRFHERRGLLSLQEPAQEVGR